MNGEIDTAHVIANNIAELRKSKGMTQAGLAEKLGYSDKSISKWERAEGLPDLLCIKRIADLFDVPVDYFFHDEHSDLDNQTYSVGSSSTENEHTADKKLKYVTNHAAVTLLSVAGVWMAAAIVFVILFLCDITTAYPFVIALPITAILSIIFHGMWGNRENFRRGVFLAVTFLVWSVLFLLCYIFREHDLWLLMILGIPATLVVAIACRVKKRVADDVSTAEASDRYV